MDGKKKLEELVARADRREFEDNYAPAQRSIAIGHDTIRSISDAYKAMEAENQRLRALIAAGDAAHHSIVRESATPSAMKDDLVEDIRMAILVGIDTDTPGREIAEAVLAIARPAILEEAATKVERSEFFDREDIASAIRALAHTTGQEGGR